MLEENSEDFLCHVCGGRGELTGVTTFSIPAYREVKCLECGHEWYIIDKRDLSYFENFPKIELTENEDGTVYANYVPVVKNVE